MGYLYLFLSVLVGCGLLLPMFRGLCVLLDITVSPAKRLNRSRCRLQSSLGWAKGTVYLVWAPGPRERGQFMGHVPVHREDWRISGVNQSYSLDGSSGAVIRCLYCSKLLRLELRLEIGVGV